jgi:hypothetical protein
MSRALQTITLGREPVNCRCHVRAFFHSHEDEYDVLVPFMLEGLLTGNTAGSLGCRDCTTRLRANRIR